MVIPGNHLCGFLPNSSRQATVRVPSWRIKPEFCRRARIVKPLMILPIISSADRSLTVSTLIPKFLHGFSNRLKRYCFRVSSSRSSILVPGTAILSGTNFRSAQASQRPLYYRRPCACPHHSSPIPHLYCHGMAYWFLP